jgi:anti-sigma factor (TIGR02949 family)
MGVIGCTEAVSRLWAYLDRHIDRVAETELEEHLGLCQHCRSELEFAKHFRTLLRRAGTASELNAHVRRRLETFLASAVLTL